MKTSIFLAGVAALLLLVGCQSLPPGVERGPHNTMAYDVLVDASPPGARIRAEGRDLGITPVHLKIFGDPDGTFHDFGSPFYEVQAFPLATNQFPQARYFGTGHMFGPEDRIPQSIYFDMNQRPQPTAPYGPPAYYGHPYAGPYPYGYYPYGYGYGYPYPYFGGPRIYIGPRWRRW
ncbi:MAG: hypothetical protein JWR69_282 [Pedosphaera sp.]|nr:hypothetical protein [Pedosphaera sp.]